MSTPASGAGRAAASTAGAPRVVALDDIAPQPWRNGAGRTRELLAWPDAAAWQVRVSVAEIDRPAPFSSFAGVERWFAVVDGEGVELDIDGTPHRLVPGSAPLRFDGEAAIACRPIEGPTRDLNLMLRGAAGAMRPVDPGVPWPPEGARCGLFTAVAGRWSALDDHGRAERIGDLPPRALLWLERAPARLRFDAASSRSDIAAGPIGWWLAATPPEDARP